MKNLKLMKQLFYVLMVLALISCKKGSPGIIDETEEESDTNPPTIYTTGYESTPIGTSGGTTLVKLTIKCWKNGESVNLGGQGGNGNALTIAADDIYIACELHNDGNSSGSITRSAGYFKNDKSTYLSQPTSYANGIAVSNGDIYVCGYDRYNGLAAYWKNGSLVKLGSGISGANSSNTDAKGIVVVGNDVYVAGYETNGTYSIAKYWKNGNAVNLSSGNNDAYATSIAIVGPDIYVGGYEKVGLVFVAKYWKNGIPTTLSNGDYNTMAYSIFIEGNDVYVAGTESRSSSSNAKYWKNGSAVDLGSGIARSIAVSENNVYVAGASAGKAIYWKNGVPVNLSLANGSSGQANAILIVPNNK